MLSRLAYLKRPVWHRPGAFSVAKGFSVNAMSQKKAKKSAKTPRGAAPSEQDVNSLVSLFSAGQYAQAETMAKAMIKRFPRNPFGLKALGAIYNQTERYLEAIEPMQKAIALEPWDAELHANLGNSYKELGRLNEAEQEYRKALSIDPGYAAVYSNLGVVLKDRGYFDEAEACYRKALSLTPADVQAKIRLGFVLMAKGSNEEAESCFREVLSLNPDCGEALDFLGRLLFRQQRWEEAEGIYQQALASNQNSWQLYNSKGNALKAIGEVAEAEVAYKQAISLNSLEADVYNNLALLYSGSGRFLEAEAMLRIALALKPDFPEALVNLGNALVSAGKLQEAEPVFSKLLDGGELLMLALAGVAGLYFEKGSYLEAIQAHLLALQIEPDSLDFKSKLLFALSYAAKLDAATLKDEAANFGEQAAQHARAQFQSWSLSGDGPLRIGFVSGDFRQHPVGFFLEGLLGELDKNRFQLFAYPARVGEDALTRRIKPFFSKWSLVAGLADQAVAKMIHEDGVHILIDLSGHTGFNRLSMFAWKPAPIQVSWLGYFSTTGMREMDYVLGDPHVTPPAEADHFTEAVWPLAESYLCFTPPAEAPEVAALPCLSEKFITFGSFNNLNKMNDDVVCLWAKVLHATPGSKLFLKSSQLGDPQTMVETETRFAAHGVAAERLVLEGHSPRSELLAAYHRVDIALDPFPYPGGTTSAEALWMGVPVLTRRGDRFLSHVGESVVSNAGLADWIAEDDADYIEKSRRFAADVEHLAQLRKSLRSQLIHSPLFNAKRFARNFEHALSEMWSKWQAERMVQ